MKNEISSMSTADAITVYWEKPEQAVDFYTVLVIIKLQVQLIKRILPAPGWKQIRSIW